MQGLLGGRIVAMLTALPACGKWEERGSEMTQSPAVLQESRRYRAARELLQHVRDKSTHTHIDGARFVPAAEYADTDLHEAERALFRRLPIVLSTSVEVPEPGSFRAVEAVGVPVLVTRDAAGTARAYLNACPHRGARLCEEVGRFEGRRITCPYHNWVFKLDGALDRISQADHVGSLEGSNFDLVPLPCEERHGLIFVLVDPHATMDLDAFLGEFDIVLAGLELEKLTHMVRRTDLPDPMNWKIALSTYFENYHFTYLHKATVGLGIYPDTSVLESYGDHAVYHIALRTIPELLSRSDAELREMLSRGEAAFTSVYFLFPNTVITGVGPTDGSHVVTVLPGAHVGEQSTDFRLLGLDPSTDAIRAQQKIFADMTFTAGEDEDYRTVQHTHRAMTSGIHPGVTFGANEPLLTDAHRSWAKAIGRPAPDRPIGERKV